MSSGVHCLHPEEKGFPPMEVPMAPRSRVVVFAALSACLVYGQVDRANLNGSVTDTSGAVVPATRVELASRDTGLKREVATGPAGVTTSLACPSEPTISSSRAKGFVRSRS